MTEGGWRRPQVEKAENKTERTLKLEKEDRERSQVGLKEGWMRGKGRLREMGEEKDKNKNPGRGGRRRKIEATE